MPKKEAKRLQVIGDIGGKGAVKYDRAQDLTENEKEQARVNIGIEDAVVTTLLKLHVAPFILDEDGKILSDEDGSILLNM